MKIKLGITWNAQGLEYICVCVHNLNISLILLHISGVLSASQEENPW